MMKALIDDRSIDGVILDLPLADFYAPQRCDVTLADDLIIQFNYGTLFGVGTPEEIMRLYSTNLVKVKESYS